MVLTNSPLKFDLLSNLFGNLLQDKSYIENVIKNNMNLLLSLPSKKLLELHSRSLEFGLCKWDVYGQRSTRYYQLRIIDRQNRKYPRFGEDINSRQGNRKQSKIGLQFQQIYSILDSLLVYQYTHYSCCLCNPVGSYRRIVGCVSLDCPCWEKNLSW